MPGARHTRGQAVAPAGRDRRERHRRLALAYGRRRAAAHKARGRNAIRAVRLALRTRHGLARAYAVRPVRRNGEARSRGPVCRASAPAAYGATRPLTIPNAAGAGRPAAPVARERALFAHAHNDPRHSQHQDLSLRATLGLAPRGERRIRRLYFGFETCRRHAASQAEPGPFREIRPFPANKTADTLRLYP